MFSLPICEIRRNFKVSSNAPAAQHVWLPLAAMACGAPVVTSNTSSLPEVAGDAALLVDPYDVAQIAQAMWLVLSRPALAAQLRAKGLARAAQFTWERTPRETIAVYERVLAGGGW